MLAIRAVREANHHISSVVVEAEKGEKKGKLIVVKGNSN
jgi:hypothetical protein